MESTEGRGGFSGICSVRRFPLSRDLEDVCIHTPNQTKISKEMYNYGHTEEMYFTIMWTQIHTIVDSQKHTREHTYTYINLHSNPQEKRFNNTTLILDTQHEPYHLVCCPKALLAIQT